MKSFDFDDEMETGNPGGEEISRAVLEQVLAARVLLKLLSRLGGSVAELLKRMNVDVQSLSGSLRDFLAGLPQDVSPDTEHLMSVARDESKKRGETVIRSVDMLLAIIRTSEGKMGSILKNAGMDYDTTSSRVNDLSGGPGLSGAQNLANEVAAAGENLEIDELVGVWDSLPRPLQKGIMAMVRDAVNHD